MIAYGTHHEDIEAAPALGRLGGSIAQLLAAGRSDFDPITKTLIAAGELASAVLDELHPHADDLHPAAALWTAPVASLARASDAAWRADVQACDAALEAAMRAIDACARSYVPREVTRRVCDRSACAALGPELYADAARAWGGSRQGERVVCLGLRTFGVTLAAAAAAGLTSRGVDASMMTLRLRGNPVDLSLVLTPRLRRAIQEWVDVTFVIVDDEPGVSGSSIACVANALSAIGVEDRRIVSMPGYRPTMSSLNDASALARWEQHAIAAGGVAG